MDTEFTTTMQEVDATDAADLDAVTDAEYLAAAVELMNAEPHS